MSDIKLDEALAKPVSGFAELEALYRATPLAHIDREKLKQWRPVKSFWDRVKPLVARQAGAKLCCAEVEGHRLHYWDSGASKKPVVVLIHGFGSSKENWSYLFPRLRMQYRVLAVDLPGFGNSTFRTDCDYRMESQAERVVAWLMQLGITEVRLAGSSMGGAISAVIAANYPTLVSGLCLMNAAGAPATRLSMLEAGILAGDNFLVANRRAEAHCVFQICFHSSKRFLALMFGWLMGSEMSHRAPLNHAIFSDLVASLGAVNEVLGKISAPTLVLWGDSDRVLDVTCVDAFLTSIPHAKAMVLPGVGHLPMVEAPSDTATVLQAFWNTTI